MLVIENKLYDLTKCENWPELTNQIGKSQIGYLSITADSVPYRARCAVVMFFRCVMLCEPLRMDARSSESWNIMLGRFRHLLLASYSRCIDQYEEHIRTERERRTDPSWTFCQYFMLQVLLTTG